MSKKIVFEDGSAIKISTEILTPGEMATNAYRHLMEFIETELVEEEGADTEDLDDIDDIDDIEEIDDDSAEPMDDDLTLEDEDVAGAVLVDDVDEVDAVEDDEEDDEPSHARKKTGSAKNAAASAKKPAKSKAAPPKKKAAAKPKAKPPAKKNKKK